MADNFKFKEITSVDLEKKTISELADRPNKVSAFGEVGLAAQQLKERFDAFPEVVKDKINEIIKALNSEDATKYIKMPRGNLGDSLYDFFEFFKGTDGEPIDDKICAQYDSPYDGKDGAQIGTLRGIIGQIESDLEIVAANNDTNSANISRLESVGSLNVKLEGLYKRVAKLEESYNSLPAAIESLRDRIENLEKA